MNTAMEVEPADSIHIPCDLLLHIGNHLLNPAERSRLGTCNRHLHQLLPAPLRIKIVHSRGNRALKEEFFVSPAAEPNKYLQASDSLRFGEAYYFWTFDYRRNNKVYMGRHTRHGYKPDLNGDMEHLYTLALRPRSPNQTWEVVGGQNGDIVMWGEDVGLSVGGQNSKPRQPDSNNRGLLSCLPTHYPERRGGSNWCVLTDSWGQNEKLQLLPNSKFVPGDDIQERELAVHAIPEVCDEGEYLLHSPWSRHYGEVTCEGYHVTVDFTFWIENGIMNFDALALPFSMGIPILETDERSLGVSPLANLLEIKSARWGCVIYYMAVAADVSEGKSLDMQRFLRRVTDHRDHMVHHDEETQRVNIRVKNKEVRRNAPPLRRAPDEIWKFILSW